MGKKLARYGDAIAEKTGIGGLWIGLVLLAAITSVPELVTGISSAVLVKSPDLALGTLIGSCSLNLAILALLDLLYRPAPILSKVSLRHATSSGAGILLITIAAVTILVGEKFTGIALGWVGISSIVIFLVYLVVVWQIFRFERSHQLSISHVSTYQYSDISTKAVWFRFAITAIAVIGAAIWMAFIGAEIAELTGWESSFVGSLFLAISTSMPEIVVSIAAIRLGAIDMAVADILGSNMFNIAIIAPVDLSYNRGPLLSEVSNSHLVTTVVMIVINLIIIAGLRFGQKTKTFIIVSWYTPVIVGLYILGAYAVFKGIGLS
jgi:cation:H+ antiporter